MGKLPRSGVWLLIMAVALVVVGAADARADTIKATYGTYQVGSGGEFTFSEYTPPPIIQQASNVRVANNTFQSFCIEKNEFLSNDTTYDYLITKSADRGGLNGGSPDPLSAETAYIFNEFWFGTLSGYNFGGTTAQRLASAHELQKVIWAFEDEGSDPTDGQALIWFNAAKTAVSSGSWTGLGKVRVLNLYTKGYAGVASKAQQSQLVVVPLPGAALLGLGLLGALGLAGAIRRKRS